MHTPEIQIPQAGRRRGRYSDEFKRQVIAACREPGVSTAAIALANGLNANLARRWVAESAQRSDTRLSKTTTA
jgi:transposase